MFPEGDIFINDVTWQHGFAGKKFPPIYMFPKGG